MDSITVSVNEGFDRLERRLLDMQVGDRLRPTDAAEETGLTPEICLAVLAGLEKAGLMHRRHEEKDCFVRQRLDLGSIAQ